MCWLRHLPGLHAPATARNASNGMVYHLSSAFHAFPETVRFSLFRDIENHPSVVDNIGMAGAFLGTALLQWFVAFNVCAGVLGQVKPHQEARGPRRLLQELGHRNHRRRE